MRIRCLRKKIWELPCDLPLAHQSHVHPQRHGAICTAERLPREQLKVLHVWTAGAGTFNFRKRLGAL